MLFNPHKNRDAFLRDDRAILRWRLDRHRGALVPNGNIAAHDLNAVVEAWLAGLHADIAPVLARVVQWLTRAIKCDDPGDAPREVHRQALFATRALAKWMHVGLNDAADWELALRFAKQAWTREHRAAPSGEAARQRLEDCMAYAVQSGNHAKGIELYERAAGARKYDLDGPLEPGSFAYCVCVQHTRGAYGESALFEAGRRMLQAKLEETWLGMGHSLRAATWLKIVYQDACTPEEKGPALTPIQTVLKAYENMPRVAAPEFAHALV